VLQITNVLNTRLKNKGATLGSAVNLIKGIINYGWKLKFRRSGIISLT